jgi:hypothetical protein
MAASTFAVYQKVEEYEADRHQLFDDLYEKGVIRKGLP